MTPDQEPAITPGPLRLNTLGSVELRGPTGAEPVLGATQPRQLAVLAYLAVVDGGRFHRRDLVTAMFWPESDSERSRHALRQTLYALRQVGGAGLIVSRGQEEIGVGPDALTCDAVEFLALLDSGQSEQALPLYQGDFLAGLHVAGAASEFEDWLSGMKLHLRRRAVTAAVSLATAAETRDDLDSAQRWLRFAIEADPLGESSYRALIRVRMSARQSGAARDLYQTLAVRLKRDLDREPSADILALLEQPPAAVSRVATTPPAPPPATEGVVTPRPAELRVARQWRIAVAVMVALIVAVMVLPGWWRRPQPTPLIAIAAFESSAPGDSGAGAIMADLLANGLARLPALQVVSGPRLLELEERLNQLPASARALRAASAGGATLLVRGELSGNEGSRRIDLELIEVGSGQIRHTVRTSAPNLLALADSAANELAIYFRAPPPQAPLSAATTRSLVAYRFYEEGLRSYYAGDGSAALRLFQEALVEDSNFAMAAYYGADAASRQTDFTVLNRLQDLMRRLAPSLPDRERLLLQTYGAMTEADPRAAILADSLVLRWPADPDAELLRSRAYTMFTIDQAQAMASARRAITLDSGNVRREILPCRACDAYVQLALSQIAIDDFPGAERSAREFIALQPHQASAHELLSGILSRLERTGESGRESAIADSLTGRYPAPGMDDLLRSGEFAAADAELGRWLQSSVPAVREDGRWWLTISLRTQGRLKEAIRLQREGLIPGGRLFAPRGSSDSTLLAQLLCESGAAREGAAIFATIAAPQTISLDPYPFHRARHTSWYLAHSATCRALAGDTAGLATLADTIGVVAEPTGSPRHLALPHYVRGLLKSARGDWSGALAEQQQAMTSPVEGLTRINFELAGALLNLHRARDAIRPLQAGLRAPLEASGLYVARAEMEERLAHAFDLVGERDSALVHYAWVERAWRRADPQFQNRYENVRRGVAGR